MLSNELRKVANQINMNVRASKSDSEMWDVYVGGETVREFMTNTDGKSCEEAVAEYVAEIPHMFNTTWAEIEDTATEVEKALCRYIKKSV